MIHKIVAIHRTNL